MGVDPLTAGLIVGAVALGAGGVAYSVNEQQNMAKDVREAEEDARKVEMAAQNEKAARERRAQIREARIQRAQVENVAASTGQTGGSATIVGGQSATQQAGVNIGNINTAKSQANTLGIARQNVVNAQSQGPSMLGSLAGSIGSQLMSVGVQQGTKSIFKEE